MGGQSRICEICGVRERHRPGFFANFPIDEQRCRTWVQVVGKEDLVHVPIEKLHALRHVCADHFKAKDFINSGKRLKKRAYPKLNLSAPPLSDSLLKDFPLHVASRSAPALPCVETTTAAVSAKKPVPAALHIRSSMPNAPALPCVETTTAAVSAKKPVPAALHIRSSMPNGPYVAVSETFLLSIALSFEFIILDISCKEKEDSLAPTSQQVLPSTSGQTLNGKISDLQLDIAIGGAKW